MLQGSSPEGELPPRRPVVVIPGLLGTKLVDPQTGRVVWGKLFDLRALTIHESVLQPPSGGSDGLELPIESPDFAKNRDRLEPAGVLDRFSVIPGLARVRVYEKLLAALSACGYRAGPIASCGTDSDLSVFYYDWRRDLVETARLLGERIEAIQENARDPDLRVDIVAHSMGGLIAEYYLLYGGEDVLGQDPLPPPTYAGARNFGRLVLIGVPQEGSIEAFRHLHEGFRVGLRPVAREAVFTMPAIYQLLPFASDRVFVDPEGRPLEVDLSDVRAWQEHGFGVFSPRARSGFVTECKRIFPGDWEVRSTDMYGLFERFLATALGRARHFRDAVSQLATVPPPGVEIHLIGSHARPTPAAVELVPAGAGWRLRFGDRSSRGPGDGRVTAESLTWGSQFGPGGGDRTGGPFPTTWVDGEHVGLVANGQVLRELAKLLTR